MITGSYLRVARESCRIGINRLARMIDRDAGHLSRVERGERQVTPALIMEYERALGIKIAAKVADGQSRPPVATVKPTPRPPGVARSSPRAFPDPAAASGSTNMERDGEVRRRQFMQALTGIAMGQATSMVALEALRHSIGIAIGNDAERWNELAASYSFAYYTTPPDVLFERLAVDLGVLGQLMAAQPDDPDLELAAAGLSMVLAISLTSTGQVWAARRWWGTARETADKSGDLSMRVMTRSQDAVKGLYDGRPLAQVLHLADETVALAGTRVCPGTAGVLAGRAQALALIGRHTEAAAALRTVEQLTGQMPTGALADESMFGWPEHRLRHTESFVFTEIGDTARAMAAQDRALALYPETHGRNRAMVEMHRVSCLIGQGNIADGLRHAANVLDNLPAAQHDQLINEVARHAIAAVPVKERRRHDFHEVHDRLTARPGL